MTPDEIIKLHDQLIEIEDKAIASVENKLLENGQTGYWPQRAVARNEAFSLVRQTLLNYWHNEVKKERNNEGRS